MRDGTDHECEARPRVGADGLVEVVFRVEEEIVTVALPRDEQNDQRESADEVSRKDGVPMQWHNKPERTKSLLSVYNRVKRYEYANPSEGYRILEEVRTDLGNYTAPPDCWHNTSIVANRVDHPDAELELVVNGLEEWPENVDLLCDALALYTTAGTATDPIKCDEIWRRLDHMDRALTGPYWRFWCYGAIYYSHDMNQPVDALKLLDDGLAMVKRDAVMNILTSYRRILVDGNPQRKLEGLDDVKRYHQKEVLGLLEERYRFGIEMGVENAYVLAKELAQLYQERAGFEYFQEDGRSAALVRGDDIRPNEYLTKALGFLDLAEALYTGSSNHSIMDIYIARARILMAQHRYREALNLMKCLPSGRRQDPSIAAMMAFAAYTIGEAYPDGGTSGGTAATNSDAASALDVAEVQAQTINALFADNGRNLERLVRDNAELAQVLLAVLRRLSEGEKGGRENASPFPTATPILS